MGTMTQAAEQFIVQSGTLIESDGESGAFELDALAGKRVLIILRINEIVEQESLHVSLWGSADGQAWGAKPLFTYPQKFYRGSTPAALDLTQRPEIKFLKASWKTNRWGRGYPRPYFQIAVEVEELPV